MQQWMTEMPGRLSKSDGARAESVQWCIARERAGRWLVSLGTATSCRDRPSPARACYCPPSIPPSCLVAYGLAMVRLCVPGRTGLFHYRGGLDLPCISPAMHRRPRPVSAPNQTQTQTRTPRPGLASPRELQRCATCHDARGGASHTTSKRRRIAPVGVLLRRRGPSAAWASRRAPMLCVEGLRRGKR
jgi:hypothetical protein